MILQRFLKIMAVALVTAFAAYALRSFVIEPHYLHERCTSHPGDAFCSVRQAIIMGFVFNLYSLGSVLLGAIALLARSRACGGAAIVLGVLGAFLYRVEFAAVGLLCGALVVTRLPVAPHHSERHP